MTLSSELYWIVGSWLWGRRERPCCRLVSSGSFRLYSDVALGAKKLQPSGGDKKEAKGWAQSGLRGQEQEQEVGSSAKHKQKHFPGPFGCQRKEINLQMDPGLFVGGSGGSRCLGKRQGMWNLGGPRWKCHKGQLIAQRVQDGP